jgi:hypothetical protein
MCDLIESLQQLAHRVCSEWRTTSHREAYVMARKAIMVKDDLRTQEPSTFIDALRIEKRQSTRDGGSSGLVHRSARILK